MISDKTKVNKNPPSHIIKFILELFNSDKLNEAKTEIDKQIVKYPNSSILLNISGAILAGQNDLDQAIEKYQDALRIDPKYAQAYNNLGIALHKLNKTEDSIKVYNKAISIKKNFAEAFNNLGNAFRELKKTKESINYFQKAIRIKPRYAEAFNNLGSAHEELGNKKMAVKNYKEAIKFKSDYAEAYNNLGLVFNKMACFEDSLLFYKKAIEIKPSYEKTYNNLGNLLNNLGKYDEATNEYHKAIKIKPDYSIAYSNLLFNLNYKINFDSHLYLDEAKKFRLNCKTIKKNFFSKHKFTREPSKLRLGLVSADFGNHPGGFFTLSTLRQLRKKNFELIAYTNTNRNDEFSHHFRPLFLKWNLIEKKSDEDVIEEILKDGVHILIDLQGHSAKNRLPIFFYKAAPIQATWLGQGSTGIPEIDYFIGSLHLTPKDEEKNYVEKILRLPEISQCFTPPDFDIKISSLPCIKNNFITFGCANKLSKINDHVIALWSKILLSIPNSKLILKNKDLDDKIVVKNIFKRFEKYKINKNRLILEGESKTRKELLEIYNKIDIALDPFPFQGNTSTCEAAWMGVPVITLKGDRYLSHFGESINSNLNMNDWICKNHDEYVSKAIKFSSNINQLTKTRADLRKIALQSPVFDSSRFAVHFSKMLWDMWQKYKTQN